MSQGEVPVKTTIPVQSDHKAFYNDLSNQLIKISRKYKTISGLDMVAIIGRIVGVIIAQMAPEARGVAKMVMNENVDQAIASIHPTITPPKKEQDNAVNDTAKDAG